MDNNENRTGVEIDILHILQVVWSRIWIILLVCVLAGGIALGYAWFMVTPTYASSIQLYVNNQYPDSPGYSSSQVTASRDLVGTYIAILESHRVLDEVLEKSDLKYSYAQLRSMVTAAAVNETEVFTVTVTSTKPEHSYQLANTLAEVLPGHISDIVVGSSVRVVDHAVQNNNPVAPSYPRYGLLGVLAGLALSLTVVIVVDIMDTRVHSEEYLSTAYKEVPLLAVIPPAGSTGKNGHYKGYYRGYYATQTPTTEENQGDEK